MSRKFKCQLCGSVFVPQDEYNEGLGPQTKLCDVCFEDCLEEYEETRRERIARENEY